MYILINFFNNLQIKYVQIQKNPKVGIKILAKNVLISQTIHRKYL